MVTLYVGGQKVACWADAEKVIANPPAGASDIELRNDAGEVVARFRAESAGPSQRPSTWVRDITPEEIERRMAGPFMTLDEFKQQRGQK